MGRYQQEFRRSLAQPDQFWRDATRLIDWYTEPATVLDRSDPPALVVCSRITRAD
jgi:propionyl-CoA synthetase